MITELERGARTLGDDIRKRAGNVTVGPDLDSALRQFLQGLSAIAAQLEKAAGELRRYLAAGAKGGKKAARKTARKTSKVSAKAAKAGKAAAKKPSKKKKATAKKGAR
ncbi:MAG TPA: hypothetical protein VGK20_14180 [Candidatus Binatia bacterium]|jgi:hypothetical protein